MEQVGQVRANSSEASEAEEVTRSVNGAAKEAKAQSYKQAVHTHRATAEVGEETRSDAGTDEGAQSVSESDRDMLPDAACEVNDRTMIQEDRRHQIPTLDRLTTCSPTGVSDHLSIQSRTAMIDEAPSPDAYDSPRRKTAEMNSPACQVPRGGRSSRRKREKLGSARRTGQLSEKTPNVEEREDNDSSPSNEDEVIQDALERRTQLTRESYGKFGLEINLVFRHEFLDFEPHGIALGKSAKLTTLNEGIVAKLSARADAIKDCLRRFTEGERMDQEVNFLRGLSKRKDIHPGYNDPATISTTIYQQRKGCRDIVNLHDFEMYSCMMILRATDQRGVRLSQKADAQTTC